MREAAETAETPPRHETSRASRASRAARPRLARSLSALLLALSVCACADLGAVRDFSRSAASLATTYPVAANAYVDSSVTSSPYRLEDASAPASPARGAAAAAPRDSLRQQRQQQVDAALQLQQVLVDYFQALARLAGDDGLTLATAQSLGSDMKTVVAGELDRTTLDAAGRLLKTLGDLALLPARESSVQALVEGGGPDAMRLLQALRAVAADWRAQVANDARQVDDTLGIAVLPSDVPPLLRLLAADRQAELAKNYAATLRRMASVVRSLDALAEAHADMAQHVGELRQEAVRRRLQATAADLRATRESLLGLR